MAHTSLVMSRRNQLLQDATLTHRRVAAALGTQCPQLALQRVQTGDAGTNVRQLVVDKLINDATIRLRVCVQVEQLMDIVQRHAQGSAMAYEGQAFDMRRAVIPVAVR